MMRSLAIVLVCASIASGLNLKEEVEKDIQKLEDEAQKASHGAEQTKKYAYVTMWVSAQHAPGFVRKASMMTKVEEKAQLKVMQSEEGLDAVDEGAYKKKMTKANLEEKLGGQEVAHMGTLKLAQQLQAVKSQYPIVLLTNDPKLLDIQFNDTKRAMYSNVVIKPIENEDWLKQQCKLQPGNGIHYQKLSIFGLTEYDKLMWIDTDVSIRKNLDPVFEDPQYDLKDGASVYGQLDDYNCDGHGDFCSGLMLFAPNKGHVKGLTDTAKEMEYCWGDQRIIRKYFKKEPRQLLKFSHKVVQWGHCGWKKADSMAVHNQRPDGQPLPNWGR